MKSSPPSDEAKSVCFQPCEAGLHRKATSSTVSGFHPSKTDMIARFTKIHLSDTGQTDLEGKSSFFDREAYINTSEGENGDRIKNSNQKEENHRFSTLKF
jgi:hypothetical protein